MDVLLKIVTKLPTQTDCQDEMKDSIQKLGQSPTDHPISESNGWPTKESEESDEEISDSGHSSWKYNEEQLAHELWAETTWTGQVGYGWINTPDSNHIFTNKNMDEAYLIDLLQWGKEGHSPKFEDDEDYEMIEQLSCIYP
ncbi:40512_t:CDS:2, partial [Gigaspora margarita]